MNNSNHSQFLLLLFCLLPIVVACSSNEPKVVEMTDEYAKMYDEYDQEYQASEGNQEYGE
ncbi:hypothetical protein [Rhodopirellula sallentina]|uniref:Secreted protein n=1 Tax=Rhodopirellula sallentina SM41 TaxID=1263870 RepID=M5UM44_9BACT|nr:hypothetical protein [Rhodopirellula sallentina]EMI57083.1 secreted protein [Rhodopirellula sallentina SM41]